MALLVRPLHRCTPAVLLALAAVSQAARHGGAQEEQGLGPADDDDDIALALGGAGTEGSGVSLLEARRGRSQDCVSLSSLSQAPPQQLLGHVAAWCSGKSVMRSDGWMSCPVCWDACQVGMPPLWLHMKARADTENSVDFKLGSPEAPADDQESCAWFRMQPEASTPGARVTSKLLQLGITLEEPTGYCANLPMKLFARWHVKFLQALQIHTLTALDVSYFVCWEISTHTLRLLSKGATLYESIYTDPRSGHTPFAYAGGQHCSDLADKVREARGKLQSLADNVLQMTRALDRSDVDCETPDGQKALSAYQDLKRQLPEFEQLEDSCGSFVVDVSTANSNL
eukprot:gb/GFBE01033563.1/.p1 GENE.gb/GFBE01033563.1/~~gb/GFBE01033563.1/.p1  ORF type:complete len:341 (+),score=64.75 gb/GFBE01033563.1/:1-1023(+)